MTNPTRCAMCGEIIVPAGEAWDHVGEPKPRHPAVPAKKGGNMLPTGWATPPWEPIPTAPAFVPCPFCGSADTAHEIGRAWCNECDAVGPADAWAAASGWRRREAAQRPLVAAALKWVDAEPYTAEHERTEWALAAAARAYRAAAVDGEQGAT
jgi:hypothetical protein